MATCRKNVTTIGTCRGDMSHYFLLVVKNVMTPPCRTKYGTCRPTARACRQQKPVTCQLCLVLHLALLFLVYCYVCDDIVKMRDDGIALPRSK